MVESIPPLKSTTARFICSSCNFARRSLLSDSPLPSKGEGGVRVALYSGAPKIPHLNPLPFCERRERRKNKLALFVGAPNASPARTGRALLNSLVIAANFLVRILGANGECDSAARGELRGNNRFARRAGFYEIVQNAVRDGFVERPLVSIRC